MNSRHGPVKVSVNLKILRDFCYKYKNSGKCTVLCVRRFPEPTESRSHYGMFIFQTMFN